MKTINNIDDLFEDLLRQYEGLRSDPTKLAQVSGLANVAAKLSKIAEIKFMVIMPGVRKGEASAKEIAYREFRSQIKNKDSNDDEK